jgi:short-subunit dehydrogenase
MTESSDRPRALITGATSGIGAAFADRLAQQGFDLLLHGRRKEQLTARAEDLERNHQISVKTIIAELSRAEEVAKVEECIQDLDRLDLLINNAGYWTPGAFWEHPPEELEAMIMVHNIAPVRFIRAALPQMLARDRGDIVNVSSAGAYLNMVTLENYSATKAYLINFTESLHVALMGTGLRVQVLTPGYVVTEFHSRLGADLSEEQKGWMRPEELVDQSMKALEKGKVVYMPGVRRRLLMKLLRALPRPVYYKMMKTIGEKVKKRWDEL